MIASELRENRGMLSPKDMTQLLTECRFPILSREFYPEEDRVWNPQRRLHQIQRSSAYT
ncbi:hypothetical protein DPMN_097474 [Dreissena polymorpha]|uniref:Uncharacterized protein n=1 Tax=Dreissena polymorpha TaxID=45954 RepID=A0A9D4LBU8_DREPO|nr:hypothetical protein DPMN_097474 [Dreissena polymorpha]